jgi:hypothetical protein
VRGWRAQLREYGAERFGAVLFLVVVLVVFTIAAPPAEWTRVVEALLASGTLSVTVRTAGASPKVRRIADVAAVVAVVAALASLLSSRETSDAVTVFVTACLVAVAPVVIARSILSAHEVTIRTVLGALSTYLLIGMCFAFVYGVVAALQSQPFFAGTKSETGADFVYFSFVTLTTTGYGDFVAARDLGRSFSVLEAIVGQLYLVTVVAVVVANLGRSRATTPSSG